ncbi:MAG TPA: hypothetical protein VFS43_24495 [Polyangiaceae bacterium]|nr:hypothetical protein [Polyangiaceae bacterium]
MVTAPPAPPPAPSPLAELAAHPQGRAMAVWALAVVREAARERTRDLAPIALRVTPGFARDQAETSLGHPVAALERGPASRTERALLGALVARAVALDPPAGVEAAEAVTADLLWAAAHTPIDAFAHLDEALGEPAAGLWQALAALLRSIDAARHPTFDRAEAFVGAFALGRSANAEARRLAAALAGELGDPALRALLSGAATAPDDPSAPSRPIVGELEPPPRGPVATVVLALTGVLLVTRLARLVGRLALARRTPVELQIRDGRLHLRSRSELLGKVLRESEHVVPVDNLARASREVRYPRLALYAGLFALALGAYTGVSLFVDGARSASPSLLGTGLLLVALGVGLELALTTLWPGARGRCRLVLRSRSGETYCVGDLDVRAAEQALARLAAG